MVITWLCPRCRYPNPANRTTCYKCGSSLQPQTPTAPAPETRGTWHSQESWGYLGLGGLLGCALGIPFLLFGILGGALMFFAAQDPSGFALVRFGLLAIPVALAFSVLFVALTRKRVLTGPCPWCGGSLIINKAEARRRWIDCPRCAKRVLVVGNRLIGSGSP